MHQYHPLLGLPPPCTSSRCSPCCCRAPTRRWRSMRPGLHLRLDPATQVAVSLAPVGAEPFDFLPADRDSARQGPGYYHLGDLTLAWRSGDDAQWHRVNTVISRAPVRPLMGGSLAAADLSPALPADLPLAVRRSWVIDDDALVLRFDLTNRSAAPVEIGSLGIPLPFDNILSDRSLDEAHALASFTDPSISQDAGYVQVTRLSGAGPALVVVPWGQHAARGMESAARREDAARHHLRGVLPVAGPLPRRGRLGVEGCGAVESTHQRDAGARRHPKLGSAVPAGAIDPRHRTDAGRRAVGRWRWVCLATCCRRISMRGSSSSTMRRSAASPSSPPGRSGSLPNDRRRAAGRRSPCAASTGVGPASP